MSGTRWAHEVEEALRGSDCLRASLERICVVVPDATRPLSFEAVLPPLLGRIDVAGSSISIVVGLGLHRPMTDRELAPIRRATEAFDVDIVQHDAQCDDLVDRGPAPFDGPSAPSSLPIALNRRVVDADQIICVGTVEPHQYAGFSGGIKAISIGCAGEATISAMHGLSFLRDPKTTLGQIRGNPFQKALWHIAGGLGDIIGLQVVPAPDGGVTDVYFDEIRRAFSSACRRAREVFFEHYDEALDWLHLPIPPVKASNFYQASRAATYTALVDHPAIRPGGAILVEASCPEKIGTGAGERACADAMRRGSSVLLAELDGEAAVQTRGGQQRAYVLAKACQRNRIVLVGAPPIEELSAMGIEQFPTVEDAMSEMDLDLGRGRRVDDVFHRIPVVAR